MGVSEPSAAERWPPFGKDPGQLRRDGQNEVWLDETQEKPQRVSLTPTQRRENSLSPITLQRMSPKMQSGACREKTACIWV